MTNAKHTCADARLVPVLAALTEHELTRGGAASGSVQPIERVRLAVSFTRAGELTAPVEKFGQGPEPAKSDPGVWPAIGGVRG
jgi:hypothetical protein